MPQTLQVHEAGYRQGSRAVVPESNGLKFKVRLMGWEPGTEVVEGSSADYPVNVITRDFADAFPVGTRMRANHDGFCEAGGDVRRIMAKTTSAPWEEEDGMYAWAVAKEGETSDFLRQFADVIGTSISAAADVEKEVLRDEKGKPVLDEDDEPVMVARKSERGVQIVERFLSMSESPYNAVDFVEAPGADGAVVALATESAKHLVERQMLREDTKFALTLAGEREKHKPGAASAPDSHNTQEEHMDEVLKAIEALTAKFETFVAESKAEASAKADQEQTVESAREAAFATAEAISAAKVPDAIKTKLIENAKNGVDVTAQLELAESVAAEAAKGSKSESIDSFLVHNTESAADGDDFSLIIGGRL